MTKRCCHDLLDLTILRDKPRIKTNYPLQACKHICVVFLEAKKGIKV